MTARAAKAAHHWERSDDEWYVEPQDCTTALLGAERFRGQIWDPCCGGGNIVRAAHAYGRMAFGTDIVNRGWDFDNVLWRGEQDFLATDPEHFPADCLIMNPPFGRGVLTEAFIRHALRGATLAKLAVFVDVRFLNSSKRANGLYSELPPDRVWIITPRPSCPPGAYLAAGNKAGGGTADFCWLVWDRTAPSCGTTLRWLRRPVSALTVEPGEAA